MHLEHADARFHQFIRDEKDILETQGNTRKLTAFPKGDVADLQFLGKRHLRPNFLRETMLRYSPRVGSRFEVFVYWEPCHLILLLK
jgi:hypothetical protein